MKIREKVMPTTTPDKYLCVDVCYSLGGMNYFSGQSEPRGYYLGCTPEIRRDGMREFTAFSGTKVLLLEVKRQSPRALAQAEEVAKGREAQLIAHVCTKNGLVLAQPAVAV